MLSRYSLWISAVAPLLLVYCGFPLARTPVAPSAAPTGAVAVTATFVNPAAEDQDDMAFWIHPADVTRSTMIGSDKTAGFVFVYDLDGSLVQRISSPHPGNVDVRYGFRLGSDCVDLVAWNERDELTIRVYRVDAATRQLIRVDDGIETGGGYGFALHRMPDGTLFAYTGPKSGLISQYLLTDSAGRVSGAPTGWQFQKTMIEGMVGDDETGYVYIGEEGGGIWRVSATDPGDVTKPASTGEDGLTADVEGLTIYYLPGGDGYIIASSQGSDDYKIYDRTPPHALLGTFALEGVRDADGIDILNIPLNSTFAQGAFATHDGTGCSGSGCAIRVVRWQDIASAVPGLRTDSTYWHPRDNTASCE
jgi:3-phytase